MNAVGANSVVTACAAGVNGGGTPAPPLPTKIRRPAAEATIRPAMRMAQHNRRRRTQTVSRPNSNELNGTTL
jgi:hypothetical protein